MHIGNRLDSGWMPYKIQVLYWEERRRGEGKEKESERSQKNAGTFIYLTQIDRRKTKDAQTVYGSISDCTLCL